MKLKLPRKPKLCSNCIRRDRETKDLYEPLQQLCCEILSSRCQRCPRLAIWTLQPYWLHDFIWLHTSHMYPRSWLTVFTGVNQYYDMLHLGGNLGGTQPFRYMYTLSQEHDLELVVTTRMVNVYTLTGVSVCAQSSHAALRLGSTQAPDLCTGQHH